MYAGCQRGVRYFYWCALCTVVTVLFCGTFADKANAVEQSRLQIFTSFPPSFYEPFVKRFEVLHPEIAVSIMNKKTTSAVAELMRGNRRNFDVFWSSSPDAFELLKQGKLLKRTTHGRQYKTVAVDGFSVDDSDGFYYGFALSAVGWMWNQTYLEREGIEPPKRWEDIADSKYYSHVVMTSPSRSGTTHLIVESILQKMGWEKGWAYLLRMSGNLVTLSARSFSVTEGVRGGLYGVGLVIDILGRAPDAESVRFQYGEPALLTPAGIGMLKNSVNTSEAEMFINFMLSPEGQTILLEPQIYRLPVAQHMYDDGKLAASSLYKIIKAGKSRAYNASLSQRRYNLVNNIFEEFITYRLLERRQLWKRMLLLEQEYGSDDLSLLVTKKEFCRLLSEVPVTDLQSRDASFTAIFHNSYSGTPKSVERQKMISQWQQFIDDRFAKANALLDAVKRK